VTFHNYLMNQPI